MKKLELFYLNADSNIVEFEIEQNCCGWYLSLTMSSEYKTGNIEIDNILNKFAEMKEQKETIAMKSLNQEQIETITQDTQKLKDLLDSLENDKLLSNEVELLEYLQNNENLPRLARIYYSYVVAYLYEMINNENIKIQNLEAFLNKCEFDEEEGLLLVQNNDIEFLIGTEEEAEDLARERLTDSADELMGLHDVPERIKDYIDKDQWVDDAVRDGGVENELARYDGRYRDMMVDGKCLLLFRVN